MKRVLVGIIIGLFSLGIFLYLVKNLSPWNEVVLREYIEKFSIESGTEFNQFIDDSINAGIIFDYLNLKNVMILISFGFVSVVAFLASIHMLIDKLFFKKFYEDPNASTAIRRAVWMPLVFTIISLVRLVTAFNIFYLIILGLIILLIVLIEVAFFGKKGRNNTNAKVDRPLEEKIRDMTQTKTLNEIED